MKKLILTVAVATVASVAFGQGELFMNNNSSQAITNTSTGLRWAAGPNSIVAVYGGAGNGLPATSLTLQSTAMTNLFAPGLFLGNQRSTAIPVGPATLQIRAWSGSFGSYEAASVAALGGDTSVLLGQSNPFNINLVAAGTPGNPTATAGLNAIRVSPVPEPSSIALGLLGLGAIVLFRRRK